jgi:putative peptidoglycan lipid II flippase
MAAVRNRSVVLVTVGALLQMLVQFLLQLILARQFGAGSEMDAYLAGATIPLVIAGMITVPLGGVLIPALSRAAADDSHPAAMRLAGQTGVVFTAATLLLAVIIGWQSLALTHIFFDSEQSAAEAALCARMLAILAWLIPLNMLTMLCQSFQNWQGRFLLPAVAGVAGPALTVAMVVILAPQWGISAVAWGILAGAAVNVLLQLPAMRGIRWGWPPGEQLRRLLIMMGPLLLASLYTRLDPLIDRSLASHLYVGAISHLGYASRLVNAILALTSGALSVVAFPYLSAAAAKGRDELSAELARTLAMLALVVVPFVAAVLLFAPLIIRDLFERGAFTAADTVAVALLLRWSVGIILGASIGEITSRAFYADHSMWPPVFIGAGLLTLAVVGKVMLVSAHGVEALVAASSVAYVLGASVLIVWLRLRLGPAMFAGVGRSLLISGGCALLACLVGGAVARLPLPLPAVWGGLAGGLTFTAAALLLPARLRRTLKGRFDRE